jgi:hypothetical protein
MFNKIKKLSNTVLSKFKNKFLTMLQQLILKQLVLKSIEDVLNGSNVEGS